MLLGFGLLLIALVIARLQYATSAVCCGDYDGYYHIKWSSMLWESFKQGRLPEFASLPFTTLNPQDYVDHHFLFHVLQIPFTWFGDMRAGAKVGAWLFATLGVFACYWLIVKEQVRFAPLWLIALLASSSAFLFRINMTKAMSLSLVCSVVGIYLLFNRKYVWLAPLAFLYVWLYSLWVLLPLAGAIWMAILLWSERRIEWKVFVWISVGVIAGLLINPYFPDNFSLLYEHIVMKMGAGDFEVRVGGEWYPWNTVEFMTACTVALIAMVAGYIAFDATDKRRAERPLFFLIFSSFLMLATMYQKRYSEYFPPFAVMFAAFALTNVFESRSHRASAASLPQNVLEDLQPFLDSETTRAVSDEQASVRDDLEAAITGVAIAAVLFLVANVAPFPERTRLILTIFAAVLVFAGLVFYALKKKLRQAITIGAAVLLGAAMFAAIEREIGEIQSTPEPTRFEAAMNFVRDNAPNEVIFNTDWDDFPKMFYYSETNPLISGLDPTYLYYKDPDLFRLYERITLGEEAEAAPLIRDRFGARYIFTDKKPRRAGEMNDFYFKLIESGWVDEVFDDGEAASVLKIRDAKGANVIDNTDADEGDTVDDDANSDEDTQP